MPDRHTLTVETSVLRSVPPATRAVGTCSCLGWSMTAEGPNDEEAKAAVREAWEPHYQRANQPAPGLGAMNGAEVITAAVEALPGHPVLCQLPIAAGNELAELLRSQVWAAKLTDQTAGAIAKLTRQPVEYTGAVGNAVRFSRAVLGG